MDNAERAALEAATNDYVAAAEALYAVHAGSAELPSPDNVVQLPVDYGHLLDRYRIAAKQYAHALADNGYAVPAGLLEEVASGHTADEQAILKALADAGEPTDMFTIVHQVAPPPQTTDGRTREHKAWSTRSIDLIRVFINLYERGFILETVPSDGEHGSRFELA